MNKWSYTLIISIGISFMLSGQIIEQESLKELYTIIPLSIILPIFLLFFGLVLFKESLAIGSLVIIFTNIAILIISSNSLPITTEVYATSSISNEKNIISFTDIDSGKVIKTIEMPIKGQDVRVNEYLNTRTITKTLYFEPFQNIKYKYTYNFKDK